MEDKGPSAITKGQISFVDLVGNSFADEVADQISTLTRPSHRTQKSIAKLDNLGFNVAKRLAIIQAEVW